MERLLRLDAFWSWLPAFRAVGETQHLPSAAKALHVSPSALSRSIKLLERELGAALFERRGGALVLLPKGQLFLEAVRGVMRQLDDATEDLLHHEPHGMLRIASVTAVLIGVVAPAVQQLTERFPRLMPELLTKVDNVVPRLLAGELDVAFLHDDISVQGIHAEHLGQLTRSVYCAKDHELGSRQTATAAELASYPFVTGTADALGHADDGWPRAWPRTIGLRTDQLMTGYSVCVASGMLAVLPDLMAQGNTELCRVPLAGCTSLELYAVRRTGESCSGRADARVIESVRQRYEVKASTNP